VNGHESVVKMPLERSADVEARDRNGRTALQSAAENGHEPVVKLLLEKDSWFLFRLYRLH
jgi:ankyrin repeat protein